MKWAISSALATALLVAVGAPTPAQRYDDDGPRFRAPILDGTWYYQGNEDTPCEVFQRRGDDRATFINENGDRAVGVIRGNDVWVPDWYGDPRSNGRPARVRGDRILWPGGGFWSRVPYRQW